VSFRVTAELQARTEEMAAARGQPLSALAREALERYLAS
jgi:predicted transcriptional regulator